MITKTMIEDLTKEVKQLTAVVNIHIAKTEKESEILASINKLFVTGNGAPSFQERVRVAEAWIAVEKWFLGLVAVIILGDVVLRLWALIYPT